MLNNYFYKTLEEAIKNAPTYIGDRNGLFDITNAAVSLKEAIKVLSELVTNLDKYTPDLNYFFYTGGALAALNYFRDNKTTPKKDFKRIDTLMNIVMTIRPEKDKMYVYFEKNKQNKIEKSY